MEKYIPAAIEVVAFEAEDVITASITPGADETPVQQ